MYELNREGKLMSVMEKESVERKYKGLVDSHTLEMIDFPRIQWLDYLGDILSRKKHMLLDCGCGAGVDIRYLIGKGFDRKKIIGIEINPYCIQAGFYYYDDKKELKNNFIIGDVIVIPFHDNSFETILNNALIHKLMKRGQIEEFLGEAYRVLNRDGIIFGRTLGSEEEIKDGKDPLALTRDELKHYLNKSRFTDIRISTCKISEEKVPYAWVKYGFSFSCKK